MAFSQFSRLLTCARFDVCHCRIDCAENFPKLLGNLVDVVKILALLVVGRTTLALAGSGAAANGISGGCNAGEVSPRNSSTDRMGTGDLRDDSLGIGGGVGCVRFTPTNAIVSFNARYSFKTQKLAKQCAGASRLCGEGLCLFYTEQSRTHVSIASTLRGHLLPIVPLGAISYHEQLQFCDGDAHEKCRGHLRKHARTYFSGGTRALKVGSAGCRVAGHDLWETSRS